VSGRARTYSFWQSAGMLPKPPCFCASLLGLRRRFWQSRHPVQILAASSWIDRRIQWRFSVLIFPDAHPSNMHFYKWRVTRSKSVNTRRLLAGDAPGTSSWR